MMQKTRFPFFQALFVTLVVLSCARQGSIDGGPRDTEPPRIDSSASTPNMTTNFNRREFELTFNEWVVLDNAAAKVLVSPPLAKRPDISLKDKTVKVKFDKDEVLKPNTTYTINFGAAVKDLHEGNVATDLRFVFSTGAYIDSLSVAGVVNDAFSGKASNNITVALYDPPSDSAVWLEKPYYFTKTDKEGNFKLSNLRPGTYQCVAFRDSDLNFKWAGPSDSLAFADTVLTLAAETEPRLTFRLFASEPDLRISGQTANRYGLLRLQYTRRPDGLVLTTNEPGLRLITERSVDTMLVWYDQAPASWQLYSGKDTVRVKTPDREKWLGAFKLRFEEEGGGSVASTNKFSQQTAPKQAVDTSGLVTRTVVQNPGRPAVLAFGTPVSSVDTSRWLWFQDSVQIFVSYSTAIDSVSLRRVNVTVAWKSEKSHELVLLPGAVTDFFGVSNTDTLRRKFTVLPEKQLGGLNLTMRGLKPGQAYVLDLLNGDKLELKRTFTADGSGSNRQVYTRLPAATYTLRLVEDRNANGFWDTGNYPLRRQPERLFTKKVEQLRANWEIESEWTVE
ncbi:MAG: Ig-like domain-containing protein [Saprospiraceae bacterium]|nr:Ig-like domain-containing protein [Saprospiraceae bacterium]